MRSMMIGRQMVAVAALALMAANKDTGERSADATPKPAEGAAAAAGGDEVEQLKAQLAAANARNAELQAQVEAKATPVQTVFAEDAARDQLGAAVFHQRQIAGAPVSVLVLAGLLTKPPADIVAAAQASDFLTVKPETEMGVVDFKAA